MVRYKVRYCDCYDGGYIIKKGWCVGTNFSEAAKAIEKYYGADSDEVTFKIFENYDDELVEDGYLENQDSGDIRD